MRMENQWFGSNISEEEESYASFLTRNNANELFSLHGCRQGIITQEKWFLLKYAKKDSPVGLLGYFKQWSWQLRVCNWKELRGKAVVIKEMVEAQGGMASNVGRDSNCSLGQKPIIKEIRYPRINWPHISDFETLAYNISMAKQNKAIPLHLLLTTKKTTKNLLNS